MMMQCTRITLTLTTFSFSISLSLSLSLSLFFPLMSHSLHGGWAQYWDDVYAFIKEAEQEGSAVLVHCQRGISRSAATCVAYFMRDKGWSKGEAYDHVRRCRPLIQPNPKFMRELDEYEARLFELQLIGAARAYGERARARERERLGQEGAS